MSSESDMTMIITFAVLHNIVRRKKLLQIGRIQGDVDEYIQRIHNNLIIVPGLNVRQQFVDNHFHRYISFLFQFEFFKMIQIHILF